MAAGHHFDFLKPVFAVIGRRSETFEPDIEEPEVSVLSKIIFFQKAKHER